MPPLRVIIARARDVQTELWLGDELMAAGFLYDGHLYLRIVPRPDGEPWTLDATSLALALETAQRQIAGG